MSEILDNPQSPEEIAYRKKPKQRPPVQIRPPLMPLIDVMFTLLMFFLIAARVRTAEGLIPSNLPELGGAHAKASLKITPIRILIHPSGGDGESAYFEIESTGYQWNAVEGLYSFLHAYAQREDPAKVPIFIKPVGPVRWEHVVNAFNQAVRAKFSQIGFSPTSGGAAQPPLAAKAAEAASS
jgi:biopolymer transport protein ExbD